MVDLDDTIIEVHGYADHHIGRINDVTTPRGRHPERRSTIATVTTGHGAPVITGQRLRKGSCGSPRGAARIIGDTLAIVTRLRSSDATGTPLLGQTSRSTAVPPSPRSVTRRGRPSSTPTPSTTRLPNGGSRAPRSPKSRSPRSAPARPPSTSRAGWWSDASPTSTTTAATGRPPCSTPGVFTRSSHRPGYRHRRQDPPRARDHRGGPRRPQGLRPGASAPGTVQRQRQRRLAGVRGDGVQPHPRRDHHHRPGPAPPPSDGLWSPSPPGSRPRLDTSPCTYHAAGPGKQRGTPCSTVRLVVTR